MGINMGMHPLLAKGGDKRKFRWMFSIQPYIGSEVSMLPPLKSARPNISFKEYQAEHLHETIYFPGKVEWQTVELTIYDVKCNESPIYDWMRLFYDPDPNSGSFNVATTSVVPGNPHSIDPQPTITTTNQVVAGGGFFSTALAQSAGDPQFKTPAVVTLYNGRGDTVEQWVYMNSYPAKIDWQELDMGNSELTMIELTLRFDRAYRIKLSDVICSQNLQTAISTTFTSNQGVINYNPPGFDSSGHFIQ